MRAVTRAKLVAAAVVAAAPSPSAAADPPDAEDKEEVMAIVTKAHPACFSRAVRVNGILMPKAEAMVIPEAEGFRVSKIMAGEGDSVASGQDIARLARPDGASVPVPSPVNGTIIKSAGRSGRWS